MQVIMSISVPASILLLPFHLDSAAVMVETRRPIATTLNAGGPTVAAATNHGTIVVEGN